jgi:hypothetical protein
MSELLSPSAEAMSPEAAQALSAVYALLAALAVPSEDSGEREEALAD